MLLWAKVLHEYTQRHCPNRPQLNLQNAGEHFLFLDARS